MPYANQGKVYFFYEDEPTDEERANVFELAECSSGALASQGHAVVKSSSGYTYVMPPEHYLGIRSRLGALREMSADSTIVLLETRLLKNSVCIMNKYIDSDSDPDSDEGYWIIDSTFYSFGNFTGGDTLSFDRLEPAGFEQHVGKKMYMATIRITPHTVEVADVEKIEDE
jgi:hypothetical protein